MHQRCHVIELLYMCLWDHFAATSTFFLTSPAWPFQTFSSAFDLCYKLMRSSPPYPTPAWDAQDVP